MELQVSPTDVREEIHSGTSFIEANTLAMSLDEIKNNHIIPVFSRDNEPLISQTQFIECVMDALRLPFEREVISEPQIRLSHPIKGRIPEARNKAAKELLPHEETIYYERAIFKVDIPSIQKTIDSENLCLSVGGIKAYNLDSIGKRSTSPQHFTVYIVFKNTVCANMCLWSDGSVLKTTVTSLSELSWKIERLFMGFQFQEALGKMSLWQSQFLSIEQVAHILGRLRLFSAVPKEERESIFQVEITDSQMTTVARNFHSKVTEDHSINLWQFYNLLTAAIKTSYIDSYVDRSINCFAFVDHLSSHLREGESSWYLL